MASMGPMKTTIDIADGLLTEAKAVARRRNTTLRALVEEGLRRSIEPVDGLPFRLRDATMRGGKGLTPEFRDASWDRVRDAIYEGEV